MNTHNYLKFLKDEIHSTVFATIDENGLPVTCVIDIMLADENGLYFITAKGKNFYNRLIKNRFVAISGMKGEDTLSSVSISIRGKVRELGNSLLEKVFQENPYMADIYTSYESRSVLTVFQLYEGTGEIFDLSKKPIFRDTFSIGNSKEASLKYLITNKCTQCGICRKVCPQQCIEKSSPYIINDSNCLHCGKCLEVCPNKAVERKYV